MLNLVSRTTLIDALGIGWKGKGRTPWRNRTAHNIGNPITSRVHRGLAANGFLVEDPAEHYGKMRVYRVTEAGAAAIGAKLPKKLVALIPATETPPEPVKLAA